MPWPEQPPITKYHVRDRGPLTWILDRIEVIRVNTILQQMAAHLKEVSYPGDDYSASVEMNTISAYLVVLNTMFVHSPKHALLNNFREMVVKRAHELINKPSNAYKGST